MLATNESLLTPLEISELLKVSPKTIYHWVLRKEIPFTKVGKHLRFCASEVLAYFKQKTENQSNSCTSMVALIDSRHRSLKTRQGNFAGKR